MSDDTQTTTETETQSPELSASEIRKHPLFAKLTEQLTAERERIAKLEAAQAEAAQAERQRKADAERKRAEEAGEYQTILAQLRAEQEAAQTAHARELATLRLRYELSRAGMADELALDGAIARYTDGDVSEYVAQLREAHPAQFAVPGMAPASRPAQGAQTGGERAPSWDTVREWEHSKDPKLREQARNLLRAHREKTGAYPY